MNAKKMGSSRQPDRLSSLPDVLLITIVSLLPFKECVGTSLLSRRWKNLCRETKNIAFKEPPYLYGIVPNVPARNSFVSNMHQWVSTFHGQVIKTFEIYFSNPVGYVAAINYLIEFAVSRQVKNLVLDFSNIAWGTMLGVAWLDAVVELPASVYRLKTLKSLKLCACVFDPSRFANQELLKSLSIGSISLRNVKSLLSKCLMLERLSLRDCWELDIEVIAGQMRELVIENCDFPRMSCSFDLPNLEVFKYSGYIIQFHVLKVNTMMKEVYLDFGMEHEYEEPDYTNKAEAAIISRLLNGFKSAKTLTVCPYLLQVIQECDDPVFQLRDVEVQHLVLRTELHPREFMGIRILLNNCPNLETLTFDYVLPSLFPFRRALSNHYRGIDAETHWLYSISYRCLKRTLKVVVFRNFNGGSNQLNVLKYLMRTGRGLVRVLERVDLYVPDRLGENEMMVARDGAMMLRRATKRAQVFLHNA